MSNLFYIDSNNFLPRIQYIFWNFSSRFLSFSKCVSSPRQSSVKIDTFKYLVVFSCGIWFPFSVTVGHFSLFKVKVTWSTYFQWPLYASVSTIFRNGLDDFEVFLTQ